MKVLILGSGLSAAFAYRACVDSGIEPDVVSREARAKFPLGAIWLHWTPFPAPTVEIINVSIGKEKHYIQKQWGANNPEWDSSFPKEPRTEHGVPVTDLIIDRLWEGAVIETGKFMDDEEMLTLGQKYDLVVRTFATKADRQLYQKYLVEIPILAWDVDPVGRERFAEQWAVQYSEEIRNQDVIVIYDGTITGHFVRKTLFPDKIVIEYSNRMYQRRSGITYARDLHPTTPRLDPMVGNVLRVGRWSTMDRKYLSHQAYNDVRIALMGNS